MPDSRPPQIGDVADEVARLLARSEKMTETLITALMTILAAEREVGAAQARLEMLSHGPETGEDDAQQPKEAVH